MKFYCPYCMNPAQPEKPCPSCGKIPGKYQPSSHHFPPGRLLKDRYLIGRSLGEGGFGITYLGFDTNLLRRVAIKEYFPTTFVKRETSVALDVTCYTDTGREFYEKGREQFLTEARTMARLESVPGIVRVLDFFPANNTAYIVMEFLAGSTLKAIVEEQGRIPAKVMMGMLAPVLRAMESMHAAGIIHRDISPDNLMQLGDGSVKLMDFGCARDIEGGRTMTVTLKHGFAPLEQYSGHGQGPWSDVYSLCATVYYCLTGKVPPRSVERGDSEQDPLVAPNVYGAALTPAQEEALLKGMAVRARNRWQSVSDLYSTLYGKTMQGFPWTPKEETAKVGETEYVAAVPLGIGTPDAWMGSAGAPQKNRERNSEHGNPAGGKNASGMSGRTEYASANMVGQISENDGIGSTEYAEADAAGRILGSVEVGSTEYAGADARSLGIGAWKEEDEGERQKQKRNEFRKKVAALPMAAKAGIGVAACALLLVVVLAALGKGGFLPTAGGRDIADATPTEKPRATRTPKPTPTPVSEKEEGENPPAGADMAGTPTPEIEGKDDPTPEAGSTPTPKATVTPVPTEEAKPTPTKKPKATATPKPEATTKPTEKAKPTPTKKPEATAIPTPEPEAGQRFTSKSGDWRCEYYKDTNEELGIKIKDYYGSKSNLVIPSEIDGYRVSVIDVILGSSEVETLQIPSDVSIWDLSGFSSAVSITIGDRCSISGGFRHCSAQKISIGNQCSFWEGSFSAGNFKEISIGNQCTFPERVFYECTDLEKISIGSNATVVRNAFWKCPKLSNVTFGSYCKLDDAFMGCDVLSSVTFGSDCEIGAKSFWSIDTLTTVSIGDDSKIGESAFWGNEKLEKLLLGDGCQIGEDAFRNNVALGSVAIGANSILEEDAFYGCANLQKVTFGKKCKIKKQVFYGCNELTEVTLPSDCKYYIGFVFSSFPETCTVTGGIPCEDLEELK